MIRVFNFVFLNRDFRNMTSVNLTNSVQNHSASTNEIPSTALEDDLMFVSEPNNFLTCPICKKVYKDPVINVCGHTFCRLCLLSSGKASKLNASENCCPIDNQPFDGETLVINR